VDGVLDREVEETEFQGGGVKQKLLCKAQADSIRIITVMA
jgi:hypothetical protein